MSIGEAIKQIRRERGYTQIEVAEKAGIAVNSLRLYEAGKRVPKIEQLEKIAEVLEVDVSELLKTVPKRASLDFSLHNDIKKRNPLQKIREEKNLSRKDLADKCHVLESDIKAYERGDTSRLSNAMLFRISIALEVFPYELYDPTEYLLLRRDSLNNRFLVQADIVNVLSFLPEDILNDIWALLWDVCHEHTELLSKCNWDFGITNEVVSWYLKENQRKKE